MSDEWAHIHELALAVGFYASGEWDDGVVAAKFRSLTAEGAGRRWADRPHPTSATGYLEALEARAERAHIQPVSAGLGGPQR